MLWLFLGILNFFAAGRLFYISVETHSATHFSVGMVCLCVGVYDTLMAANKDKE